jgi:hypothetical protein
LGGLRFPDFCQLLAYGFFGGMARKSSSSSKTPDNNNNPPLIQSFLQQR